MYYAELYDFRVVLSNGKLFVRLLQSLAAAAVVLAVLFYLLPSLAVGRGMLSMSLLLTGGVVVSWRFFYQWIFSTRQFKANILIIGTGEEARKLAREVLYKQPLGYELRGFIGENHEVGRELL
jgi:FlaA1/EpsC-like NDP-sugar epimerase